MTMTITARENLYPLRTLADNLTAVGGRVRISPCESTDGLTVQWRYYDAAQGYEAVF